MVAVFRDFRPSYFFLRNISVQFVLEKSGAEIHQIPVDNLINGLTNHMTFYFFNKFFGLPLYKG